MKRFRKSVGCACLSFIADSKFGFQSYLWNLQNPIVLKSWIEILSGSERFITIAKPLNFCDCSEETYLFNMNSRGIVTSVNSVQI